MTALLEIEGLTKRFGGVVAVDRCSFSVPAGTITALVGPNGSGKTTVFNLVTGYAQPDTGLVRLDGDAVRRPHPVRLARRGLARTVQQARIFPQLTLVENLAASLQQPWRAIVRRAVSPSDRTRALQLLDEFDLLRLADHRARGALVASKPARSGRGR